MVLQVKEIHKQYPQFLLDRVSFELPEGAIMGLIGENGAGKSTTMRIILGMAQADSGSVSVFGHEGVTEQDRAQIGVVFDELPFNQTLFVSHLGKVMQGIYPNWDQQAYEGYLARFRLPDKKELKDFSRGMKMKLSLAVAMSHHARLLILDEPVTGLDPEAAHDMYHTLEYLNRTEGIAIVMVTHDLQNALKYATHILHAGHKGWFFGTAAEFAAKGDENYYAVHDRQDQKYMPFGTRRRRKVRACGSIALFYRQHRQTRNGGTGKYGFRL